MMSLNRPVTNSVYVTVLRKDLPSPLSPESDEEQEAKPESPKSEASGKKTPPASVKIDFDKISQRILALPLPARHYLELLPGKEGAVFLTEGSPIEGMRGGGGVAIYRFDLKGRKADQVLENVSWRFPCPPMARKCFTGRARGGGVPRLRAAWFIAPVPSGATPPAGGPGPAAGAKPLNLSSMEVAVDPPVEWRQMYHEAFRLERDFFYDGGFHGLDLKATEKLYEPYLAGLGSRGDLNYIFREAFGNLTVGHLYVVGGDSPSDEPVPVGLLGADYRIENGRYRFARIYDGENWNPQLRAPLTQPGVNVAEGEYLLAVNGREVTGRPERLQLF